jgi:hypothetical protein
MRSQQLDKYTSLSQISTATYMQEDDQCELQQIIHEILSLMIEGIDHHELGQLTSWPPPSCNVNIAELLL